MKQLAVFYYNDTFVVDSREVAKALEKEHKHLLRDIKSYTKVMTESNVGPSGFFITASYQDSTGRIQPCYFLTRKGCDMVANKLTGRKGILFTVAYVSKFEAMEKALANPTQVSINDARRLRAEALHMNAKARHAQIIKDLARQFKHQLSSESVQSIIAGISAYLMGTPLLPLPVIEKTYTASDIGKLAGINRSMIGKLANVHGLKTEEYGLWILDTIPPDGRQVPTFRYNEKGKKKLLELAGGQK